MELKHIPLSDLKVSKTNVRKHGGKDIADLIPSIKAHGILQPLLVRANGKGFEIVAGQRRYRACSALAEETDIAPAVALRLAVAHMIGGSALWSVKPENARPANDRIAASMADNKAVAALDAIRASVGGKLDDAEGGDLCQSGLGRRTEAVFLALMEMDDEAVHIVLAYAMAETLQCGTAMVDRLGDLLDVDMAEHWQVDATFIDHCRDREALLAMVKETAGEEAAKANATAPMKTLKAILYAAVTGDGRPKAEGWLPPYMAFPAKGYSERFDFPIALPWEE